MVGPGADYLFIMINCRRAEAAATIKTHIRNLYKKLGVAHRQTHCPRNAKMMGWGMSWRIMPDPAYLCRQCSPALRHLFLSVKPHWQASPPRYWSAQMARGWATVNSPARQRHPVAPVGQRDDPHAARRAVAVHLFHQLCRDTSALTFSPTTKKGVRFSLDFKPGTVPGPGRRGRLWIFCSCKNYPPVAVTSTAWRGRNDSTSHASADVPLMG